MYTAYSYLKIRVGHNFFAVWYMCMNTLLRVVPQVVLAKVLVDLIYSYLFYASYSSTVNVERDTRPWVGRLFDYSVGILAVLVAQQPWGAIPHNT